MVEHPDALAAITLDFSRLEETNSSPFEETEGFTLNA
jgi:hypothetical protein